VLQAYVGCSDDEVVEATTMDRRWQLVLDCLDASRPPFSKGTLVAFRRRLIEAELDRRRIERTVALAERRGGFGSRALRAALDLDWDDPAERTRALVAVLDALGAVERFLAEDAGAADEATAEAAALSAARQVREQDVERAADGTPTVRRGVARERRISIEDAELRPGRKSRSHRVDGYKRHVLRDLDSGLIRAVGVTPANAPEASVTEAIVADLDHQAARLGELHIDRADLSRPLVRTRPADLAIFCKAWPVRNGGRFPKTAFTRDWERRTIRCPNGAVLPFEPGGTVRFPAPTCTTCPLRDRCTTSANGRSVAIHPDERLLAELRQRQATPDGRAKLRERVAVEHALAHVGRWQGRRARYRGARNNLFDLRRCALVHNLHVIARLPQPNAA
jgi:transposase